MILVDLKRNLKPGLLEISVLLARARIVKRVMDTYGIERMKMVVEFMSLRRQVAPRNSTEIPA